MASPTVVNATISTASMDIPVTALIEDMAQDIHPSSVIAARYGLTLVELHDLVARPYILRAIKSRRAIFMSDSNAGERLQTYAQHVLLNKLPTIANMIDDDQVPVPMRVESLKTIKAAAGATDKAGLTGGSTAANFSVNFHFAGAPSETITTVVADGNQAMWEQQANGQGLTIPSLLAPAVPEDEVESDEP